MKSNQNSVNIFLAIIAVAVVTYLGIMVGNKNSNDETTSTEKNDSNLEYACLLSPTVGMTRMDYLLKEDYINKGYKYIGLIYYENCNGQAMVFEKKDDTAINTSDTEIADKEEAQKCAIKAMKETFVTSSTCTLYSTIGNDNGWAYNCSYKTSSLKVTVTTNAKGYLVYYIYYDGDSSTSGLCN